MRKGMWSAAAFVIAFSVFGAPRLQAADEVAMGKDNKFVFTPADITVPVGSTVVWRNVSDLPHDAVADNGAFESRQLQKDDVFEFTFTAPGEFTYICTEPGHADAGMKGVVKVTGGSSTPSTATTTTTQAQTTPTTEAPPAPGQSTTTTAAGGSTTTTTAGTADPGVTTSSGPATTPTSAPDVAGDTTTTTAGHGTEEAAGGGEQAGDSGSEQDKKTNPLAVAFAGISTVILIGITGKLLASRS